MRDVDVLCAEKQGQSFALRYRVCQLIHVHQAVWTLTLTIGLWRHA